LCKDQRQARAQALADFQAFVDDLNAELSVAKRSRQRQATKEKFTRHRKKIKLNAFVDVELRLLYVKGETTTLRTYQATIVVDEQAKRQAQHLDGFWLLVTNHIEKAGHRYKLSAKDAIVPSDQGSTYASGDYQALLKNNELVCSMSRKGECLDNGVAESFFGSLKTECRVHEDYRTKGEARQSLFEYIEIFCNRQRRISYLGYLFSGEI
jgi:hypothetical protein